MFSVITALTFHIHLWCHLKRSHRLQGFLIQNKVFNVLILWPRLMLSSNEASTSDIQATTNQISSIQNIWDYWVYIHPHEGMPTDVDKFHSCFSLLNEQLRIHNPSNEVLAPTIKAFSNKQDINPWWTFRLATDKLKTQRDSIRPRFFPFPVSQDFSCVTFNSYLWTKDHEATFSLLMKK